MGGGDSTHRVDIMRSPDSEMLSEHSHVVRLPDPGGAALRESPRSHRLPLPRSPAVDTDQELQSSFTTEPVGYRVPWNSQGHSAGATQPPSSKISPRVTAKAHLTYLRSCSQTFHGSPGPVKSSTSSTLFHHPAHFQTFSCINA